jgi:cytochrome c oxidase subunit 2
MLTSLNFLNLVNYCTCDVPVTDGVAENEFFNNLGFQDPASPLMEGLIGLHSDIWGTMLFVAGFVSFMLVAILYSARNTAYSYKIHHDNLIEIIWTTIPALILCIIAIPSFTVLYGMDEIVQPSLTLKAIGRQWYWTYEYGDYEPTEPTKPTALVSSTLAFDSNLLPDDELEQGQLRLLDVDNRVVLPVNKHIRLLTSSGDVIHSFAVPSLAVKLDAIPGRLNQTMMFIKRQGVFYGQCSELCGTGHSMMPIAVEAVQEQDYVDWVNAKLQTTL